MHHSKAGTTLTARWLATLAILVAGAANAQSYPNRPIQLAYPYAAGGAGDVSARVIAAEVSKNLKQPIVIENRVGGGGMLGLQSIMTAPPDGYRLSFLANGLTVNRVAGDPKFQ